MANAVIKVVYLNGIDNTPEEAVESQQRIKDIIKEAGYDSKFDTTKNVEHRYNLANDKLDDKFVGDLNELYQQARLSARALSNARNINANATATSPEYIENLGLLYEIGIRDKIDPITGAPASSVLKQIYATVEDVISYINAEINNNNKIIFVAHSQGNYHAEAANAYLINTKNATNRKIYVDSVRFVGVASVAASTPNNRHLSAIEDDALAKHDLQTIFITSYQTLARNVKLCVSSSLQDICFVNLRKLDTLIHNFVKIYTSDWVNTWSGYKLKDILVGFINASFDELTASDITSITPVTATISVPTVFTVVGKNLPLTAYISLLGAPCTSPINRSETGFIQTCTPNAASGVGLKMIYVANPSGTDFAIIGGTARTVNVVAAPTSATGLLTDTGISASQCYTSGSNTLVSCASTSLTKQDGQTGRDVTIPNPADGKLGFSYSEVPNAAGGYFARTECVKDNVTGLIWEGKPTSGFRANTLTYPYFGDNRVGDASAYPATVNAGAGLCGFTDWRLPTVDELQSIVDYGAANVNLTVDSAWFLNTAGFSYWTSSPYAGAYATWVVSFYFGHVGWDTSGSYYLRLVRGS